MGRRLNHDCPYIRVAELGVLYAYYVGYLERQPRLAPGAGVFRRGAPLGDGRGFPSGASRYSGGHVQPQHRGDSRRDQQPHNDGRNCSRHHHPRLRCRLHHARSKRPIRKAAISEIIRVAAALKPSTTSKIAARFPERQLSLRQEAPCLYG
jgi:hypothetical protein